MKQCKQDEILPGACRHTPEPSGTECWGMHNPERMPVSRARSTWRHFLSRQPSTWWTPGTVSSCRGTDWRKYFPSSYSFLRSLFKNKLLNKKLLSHFWLENFNWEFLSRWNYECGLQNDVRVKFESKKEREMDRDKVRNKHIKLLKTVTKIYSLVIRGLFFRGFDYSWPNFLAF